MATVINNPQSPTPTQGDNNSWFGLTLMLLALFMILYLGVPYLRNMNQSQESGTTVPTMEEPTGEPMEATQAPEPTNTQPNENTIMIPDTIDVNINQVSPSPTN